MIDMPAVISHVLIATARRIAGTTIIASFAFGALAAGLPAPASAADPIVMKIGTATLNDTQHEWMKRYKAAVERDSKGRIAVQLYPSSQLGSIPREIEDTQFGAIQCWVGPPEFLTGVDQRFQVLSSPATFTSLEQAQKTVDDRSFNAAFLALGTDKGLKPVGVWISGSNALMVRKPVRKLADAKGLKIRILAGPLQEAEMGVLGASGVPMPLDQVASALQQGAIDGIITNISTATPLKYYTSAPYATEINQPYIFSIAVVSKSWFEKLPPDLQKIVAQDGGRVGRDLFPFITSFLKEERAAWTAGGGELISLPAAEQKQLITELGPISAEVLKDKPAVLSMYKDLIAARNRTK
jgi:TRAP-type C4-dicarboxylate transport system substrate-binding protein